MLLLYCKQSHLETSAGPEWSEMRRGWGSLGCAWQVRQKIWVWLGTSWTSQVTLGRPCLHIQYPLYFTKHRKMAKEWTSLTAHCTPAGEPHPQALRMKKTPCPHFRSHMYNFSHPRPYNLPKELKLLGLVSLFFSFSRSYWIPQGPEVEVILKL